MGGRLDRREIADEGVAGVTDLTAQYSETPLERLRGLAAQAGRQRHMLSGEARKQAFEAAAEAWADAVIPPGQVLAAAHGIRGDLVAGALVSVWRGLTPERRQAIVQALVCDPDETGTRNVYAAAGLVDEDPDAAVGFLQPVRANKDTLERVRAAFFRERAERIRGFLRAESPQFRVRKVLTLLQAAAQEAGVSSDAQWQTAELLLRYVSEKGLIGDSTFSELLNKAREQVLAWSAPRREEFVRNTRSFDTRLADRLFPGTGGVPSTAAAPGVAVGAPDGAEAAPEPPTVEGTGATAAAPTGPGEARAPSIERAGAPSREVELATGLVEQARKGRSEAGELGKRSDELIKLAELLERAAAELGVRERERQALSDLERKDAEQAKALKAESALRRRAEESVQALERDLQESARRVAEWQQSCRLIEKRMAEQETKALAQMQKFAQSELTDFRTGLARALHASVHDLPRSLEALPRELAGVIAARLEQVLRELERQGIPLRTWREASR